MSGGVKIQPCGCPFGIPKDTKPGDMIHTVRVLTCEDHVQRSIASKYGGRNELDQS